MASSPPPPPPGTLSLGRAARRFTDYAASSPGSSVPPSPTMSTASASSTVHDPDEPHYDDDFFSTPFQGSSTPRPAPAPAHAPTLAVPKLKQPPPKPVPVAAPRAPAARPPGVIMGHRRLETAPIPIPAPNGRANAPPVATAPHGHMDHDRTVSASLLQSTHMALSPLAATRMDVIADGHAAAAETALLDVPHTVSPLSTSPDTFHGIPLALRAKLGTGAGIGASLTHLAGLVESDSPKLPTVAPPVRAMSVPISPHPDHLVPASFRSRLAAGAASPVSATARQSSSNAGDESPAAARADGWPTAVAHATGSLDAYSIGAVIGVGAFSKVRLGTVKRSRLRVALKLIELRDKTVARVARNEALVFAALQAPAAHPMHEAAPLQVSRGDGESEDGEDPELTGLVNARIRAGSDAHPNVMRCFDIIRSSDLLCLVLDYCPGGDLFDLMAYRHDAVTMADAQALAFQLMDALAFMHRKQLAHRDLKLENILLKSKSAPFHIQLSDFGLSTLLVHADQKTTTTRCGSEEYSAPEVIIGKPHDPQLADAWSAGVVLYAILVGHLPFSVEARDVVVEESVTVPVKSTAAAGVPVPAPAPGPGASASEPQLPALVLPHAVTPTPVNHHRRVDPGLLRQLEDKLTLGHSSYHSAPPAPPATPSPPLTPTNPGFPTRTIRRRSTRKAGRRALWHRIARAEFSFPDEAVEVPDTDDAEGGANGGEGSEEYPLLTPETKALVRWILEPSTARRPTAAKIREHAWVAAGGGGGVHG
ncbi:CAMK/CAMKL protein kinase [Allomyces macrogynus ATCC 38327]|uniref:CAMK/CAMKL protein kinase n=1 Tax=Allomyces macrogynus (strain ATCC 38327) TaxID=578462 RepID=A0A0L0TCT0_ALLM3|nr:CAMK/CAMKL protein kinase [Allomyces macrogynus ATCC 38327]|eukprot:KNE72344.1 CAMK/CAMKL protein kinase [Allomyces macrogynus ATCC 38327]